MPWGCLGAPAPAPPAMATLRFALGNAATGATGAMPDGQPAAGLVIRACRPLDFTCDEPLATSLPTDDAGQTTLIVPGGFDGYFEMPDAAGFVPAIYWHAPIQGSQLDDQAVLPPNLVALAAELVEVTVEGDAGTVIPIVLDCNGVAAAGVRFNLSDLAPSEHFFYLNDSVPSHTATATDSTGGALLFNAPPGTITMTATTPGGQLIGSSTTEVRAGWATFVQFTPSQAKLSPP
jgi:hypothetical protein